MKKASLQSSLLLLLAAVIWGTAFVAQKDGMNYVEPFTYTGIRSLVGGLVLLALLPLLDRARAGQTDFRRGERKDILLGGAVCGVLLFAASNLQQFGIALQDPATNVGKAGFITTCYTVIVPIASTLFGKKPPKLVWAGAILATAGLFFLSVMDGIAAGQGLGLGRSDLLLLLCAFGFSAHIMAIDRFSPLADGVRISCVQFLVAGALCLPCMFLFEHPTWANILSCWLPILYAGVMSSGVAFTLQIIAQRNLHPAVASLLMSLESVFSVLAGYVLMPGSSLSGWELLGCALVFLAVVVVELAPSAAQETLQ